MGIKINYEITPITFYRFYYLLGETDYNYVGSTTNMTRRLCEHKSRCYDKNCRQYLVKLYQTIRDTGGFQNWKMVILETRLCQNKIERMMIEQDYLNNLNCNNCNVNRAFNSREYKLKWFQEYNKKWYIDNKIELSIKRKQARLLKKAASSLEVSLQEELNHLMNDQNP